MFKIFKLFFYDPEPLYGGWFSLDKPFFAVDEESIRQELYNIGWGGSGIKVKEI